MGITTPAPSPPLPSFHPSLTVAMSRPHRFFLMPQTCQPTGHKQPFDSPGDGRAVSPSKGSECLGHRGKQVLGMILGSRHTRENEFLPGATEAVGRWKPVVSVVSHCGYLIHQQSWATPTEAITQHSRCHHINLVTILYLGLYLSL